MNTYFFKRSSTCVGDFKDVDFLIKYFEGLGYNNQESFQLNKVDIDVLIKRCKTVLKHHDMAISILPTIDDVYDDEYFDKVRMIKDYLELDLLPEFEELLGEDSIYFEAS